MTDRMLTDGQVTNLRAAGMTDDQIARAAALAALTGDGDVGAAWTIASEICNHPTGELAAQFHALTADTLAAVSEVPQCR